MAILSGELIPLYLFPESASWIWRSLPFHLYVFAPTQFALGKMSGSEFMGALVQSLVWILAFWAALKLVWKISIRRYASIGG